MSSQESSHTPAMQMKRFEVRGEGMREAGEAIAGAYDAQEPCAGSRLCWQRRYCRLILNNQATPSSFLGGQRHSGAAQRRCRGCRPRFAPHCLSISQEQRTTDEPPMAHRQQSRSARNRVPVSGSVADSPTWRFNIHGAAISTADRRPQTACS